MVPVRLAVEADRPHGPTWPGEEEALALLVHAQPDVAAPGLHAEPIERNGGDQLVRRFHLEDSQAMLIDGVEAAQFSGTDIGGSVPLHLVADQEIRHLPERRKVLPPEGGAVREVGLGRGHDAVLVRRHGRERITDFASRAHSPIRRHAQNITTIAVGTTQIDVAVQSHRQPRLRDMERRIVSRNHLLQNDRLRVTRGNRQQCQKNDKQVAAHGIPPVWRAVSMEIL